MDISFLQLPSHIYVNWNQNQTEYVCLLPELKQLIHFYDDVNSIYSIKQCWCSFLSLMLVGWWTVWARGAGCGPAVWCPACWQCGSVAASEQYVSSSIPDSEGWPPEPGSGPDTTTDTSDTWGEPVQWPGEVAAAEKEKIFCHVECDAIRLTSHTTIRKLKQVADTFQPCH